MKEQVKEGLYIHAQDFADMVVGPFGCGEDVDMHLDFIKNRGDSAKLIVVDHKEAVRLIEEDGAMLISVEDDLNFDPIAATEAGYDKLAGGWVGPGAGTDDNHSDW